MDEQSLMDFIMRMTQKDNSDTGEGDYKDFLANYMNAMNRGADEEQIRAMLGSFGGDRRQEMMNYGGGPNLEKNQTIREARGGLNNLLRSR